MNDEHLEIINDLQNLLNISYREAYQIVDEYLEYGDVDLSDFEDDILHNLKPIEKDIVLNILSNQDTISLLNTYNKEVILNILNNDLNVSQLTTHDKEIILNVVNNNNEISKLNTKDKEVVLSLLDDTKIKPLTTKSSTIDLGISGLNKLNLLSSLQKDLDLEITNSESVQFLDMSDKELSIDIEFGLPNTPITKDLDNINPLSIRSISSIYQNDINVNKLDKLSISDIHTIKNIEQEELKTLSISKLSSIHEFNLNEIDSISLDKVSNISNIGNYRIGKISINNLPNITPFDIESIDTLQLSKLDNFKWGRINARVNKKELPLLSLNPISDINNDELSELEELVLFDIPELPNFDIQQIKTIEYETIDLDMSLDVFNEIIHKDILPPTTKEDFINAGADPDTVDMYFNDYLSTSESYSLETMRLFFKHALTEKDRAIEAGGNYKGLYKIVTEERGTFLPFITELYMTELCQYDEDVGTVIIRYHSMLDGFLINEAHYYNSLI